MRVIQQGAFLRNVIIKGVPHHCTQGNLNRDLRLLLGEAQSVVFPVYGGYFQVYDVNAPQAGIKRQYTYRPVTQGYPASRISEDFFYP